MSYLNGQWWLEGLAAVEIMTIVNSTLDYSLAYAELFIPIYTFFLSCSLRLNMAMDVAALSSFYWIHEIEN